MLASVYSSANQTFRFVHIGFVRKLCFQQICDFILRGAKSFWIEDQQVPFAVLDDQWVGYDDDKSVQLKVEPTVDQHLCKCYNESTAC